MAAAPIEASCSEAYGRKRTPGMPGVLVLLVEEGAQMLASRRVAQLAQRLGFDLTDSLAGDIELLADFLEGVVGVHVDAEAHAQYLGLDRNSVVEGKRVSVSVYLGGR